MWALTALVITLLMLILMGMGLPVAFTMIAIGLGGLWMSVGPDMALSILGENMFSIAANQGLAPVPLFVLMGMIFLKSGIGEDLFLAVQTWMGRIPGGLAAASVGACAVFGAMCGSSTATTATIGTIATPSMIKVGYDKSLASGVVAAAGALGPVIPPSIYMIVYGITAEESIGKLFIAALVPGFLLATIMIIQVVFMALKNPEIAPSTVNTTWAQKFQSLRGLIVPIIIVFLVLGSIYLGFATPTEAAAVGVSGSIIIAVVSRRLTLPGFIDSVATTASF
ncbi:MAG: TRAP transporter large permease subunit, partial [Deltaproteobacteria bacterium]|nr:TRAP transporter large permease subunit [Deltaproteobacteria bacterium]